MRLGHHAGGHRQDVHANFLGTNRFGGCARTICEALLANVSLAWLDDRDTVVC